MRPISHYDKLLFDPYDMNANDLSELPLDTIRHWICGDQKKSPLEG